MLDTKIRCDRLYKISKIEIRRRGISPFGAAYSPAPHSGSVLEELHLSIIWEAKGANYRPRA